MLTEREHKQIKTAIEAAWSISLMGYGDCMPKQNVLAILVNYVEVDEEAEALQKRDL